MGVGCKLVLVMMSTNIGKNPAVSGEGHVLTAYAVFSGGKIGQYADKSSWNPFSKIKLRKLSLKYILIQVHDQHGQY